MKHRSHAPIAVTELLSSTTTLQISHEAIALITGYDRRTIISTLLYMQQHEYLKIYRGTGRKPNAYRLTHLGQLWILNKCRSIKV